MRTAIVTGSASGIGAACVRALLSSGARVVGLDLMNDSRAAEDGLFQALPVDIRDDAQVRAAVQEVEASGAVDILVNCAGVGPGPFTIDQMTDDTWRTTIETNLTGTFHLCRSVLPHMYARKSGSIVNIASVMGHVGNPGFAAYVTAKHGLLGLTKSLALEAAPYGVRVNAVSPGYVVTPQMQRYLDSSLETEGLLPSLEALHPLGRLGSPEEVAAAVLWLSGDAASFVTGTSLDVDGGYLSK